MLLACGLRRRAISDLRAIRQGFGQAAARQDSPLPEVKPYEPFAYDAFDLPDPFKPRKIEPPKTAAGSGIARSHAPQGAARSLSARRSVRWSARSQQNKATYALVKTPERNMYQVKSGNYMGQNFGVIIGISESTIKLKELMQDSGGDWTERISTLKLAEERRQMIRHRSSGAKHALKSRRLKSAGIQ